MNNWGTVTSNQKGFQPLIINGRPVKSINQFYNKKKDKLKVVIESKDYRQKEI